MDNHVSVAIIFVSKGGEIVGCLEAIADVDHLGSSDERPDHGEDKIVVGDVQEREVGATFEVEDGE